MGDYLEVCQAVLDISPELNHDDLIVTIFSGEAVESVDGHDGIKTIYSWIDQNIEHIDRWESDKDIEHGMHVENSVIKFKNQHYMTSWRVHQWDLESKDASMRVRKVKPYTIELTRWEGIE